MTRQEKLKLIESFERAYEGIGGLLAKLPDEALEVLPHIPDAWSTNDHLTHILDSELMICFMLRASIAEPGFVVPIWDEKDWHRLLRYEAQDGRKCFTFALGIRTETCASLRANVDLDWNAFWIHYPRHEKLGLADLLERYRDHAKTHEGFIKRNKEAWEASHS
ncbi:MAG: hypothetical protein WCL50_07615 [Spirochaetota bacterium]